MIAARASHAVALIVLIILFAGLVLHSRQAAADLGEPALLTGYLLYALFLGLGAFNVRKRLAMVPLGRAGLWTAAHVYGGVFALPLYWLHTGNLWPSGLYEQVLAVLFYAVAATGFVGYAIQRVYPAWLTQTGLEIIYERIPAELARLRTAAATVVFDCTREIESDTLARHHLETFAWYFRRPRFALSYLFGGRRGAHWVLRQQATLTRYLDDRERDYLDRLIELGLAKTRLDVHHALQSAMKLWLLVHLPLAVAAIALATWHLVLVHVYAL
ncbi:MAG: hypothetical protein ACREER_09605 [Alphaproteobacteria bacterium]